MEREERERESIKESLRCKDSLFGALDTSFLGTVGGMNVSGSNSICKDDLLINVSFGGIPLPAGRRMC